MGIGDTRHFPKALRVLFATHVAFIVVLIIYVVSQIWCWRHATPVVFPDSIYYEHLSDELSRGNWGEFYNRTPGYPVFLWLVQAVAGKAHLHAAVMAVQFCMGVLTLPLMYAVYLRLAVKPIVAAMAVLFSCLDLQTLMFRQHILTETLTFFLITAAFWIFLVPKTKPYWTAIVLGVVLFCLVMVRPSFQLLGWTFLIIGALCNFRFRTDWRELRWYLSVAIVTQTLLFGWSYKIYRDTGAFTLSTATGSVLISHTSEFIDQAPTPQFSPYKEALQRSLATGIHPAHAIFPAMDELEERTHQKVYEISPEYLKLAKWLILRNFPAYLKQVADGCLVMTADSPAAYYADSGLQKSIDASPFWHRVDHIMHEQLWLRATRMWGLYAFAILTLLTVFISRLDKITLLGVGLIVGTALYNVLIHCAINTGDLARYRIPLQPWIFSLIPPGFVWILSYIRTLRIRSRF